MDKLTKTLADELSKDLEDKKPLRDPNWDLGNGSSVGRPANGDGRYLKEPGFGTRVEGYAVLEDILAAAHSQAAIGKGKARHATGPIGFRPWDKQPILEISRQVGPGYAAGQAAKKVQEAVTMSGNGDFDAARSEALGAIVYAAALYKLLAEMQVARK